MPSLKHSLQRITALENLTEKDTAIHRLSPMIKLMVTIFYVIIVISIPLEEFANLMIFACFPAFLMIIGEVPLKPLAIRCGIALPFAFFAGLSNLFVHRNILFYIGGFGVTKGMLVLASLMLKTILTVLFVLLLVATTSMNDLIYTLIRLHIPHIIIIQIMMTYRYMSVLLKEASLMYHAYILRAPKEKGIKMKDMGMFLGQLILRSMDRAERIYQSMQCRGFDGRLSFVKKEKPVVTDWIIIIMIGAFFIILRVFNLGTRIGSLLL